MTERQALIARKLAMQAARNRARRMEGMEVLRLFALAENPALQRFHQMYFHAFLNGEPASRLPYRSPAAEVHSWLLEQLGISEGDAFFCPFGSVWAELRILNPAAALQSLWAERDFVLVSTDFRRMLGAGFDSRDEEHFLIDILELPGLAPEDVPVV